MKNDFWKSIYWGLILVFLFSSCATTTGPAVSSQEVAARTRDLQGKAAQFKSTQRQRVQAIANRIMEFMPDEDRHKLGDLRIEVAEDQKINAHAEPGKITVDYGLLRFVDSDDELACVIGHELAHLAKGHYAKKLAATVAAAAAGIATQVAIDSAGGSGVGGIAGQAIAKGIAGAFSRDYEREADYYGLQYLYLAGFDVIEGMKIWERFAVEIPETMKNSLFASHPASPERLVRAEKIVQEMQQQGIQPAYFKRPSQTSMGPASTGMLNKVMSVPANAIMSAASTVGTVVISPLNVTPGGSSQGQAIVDQSPPQQPLTEKQKKRQAMQAEIERLKANEGKLLKELQDKQMKAATERVEFERILLEAKEASMQLRYAEFGIEDMGLAKNVTNFWVAKKVSGAQLIFPLGQGEVDWYVQYKYLSANSFKALAAIRRHYRVYWYAPDGRLFSERDFIQSGVRAEFAKTTLQWDPALGNFLVGKWLVRVFEDGKLLDERNFEIIV